MTDVIVIGGGVIGLSAAYELARQGVAVKILEQGQFAQEASWAGAGILPPGNPLRAKTPEARLRSESHRLWPEWTARLLDQTGIDNGYRRCGGLEVRLTGTAEQLDDEIAAWQDEGVEIQRLSADELREYERALIPHLVAGFRLPELCQVRNPRHLKALLAACSACGVELQPGSPVVGFDLERGRVAAVRTPGETHKAGQFLIAGGAWSGLLLAGAGLKLDVQPVRGQIVMLSAVPVPFRHVIQHEARYLVPRPDGRVLIGATEERVGFDKRNTAGAVAELIGFATGLVPSLAEAKYERAWSGLRPCSTSGLPYLGLVPGLDNAFIATGHFRAGLQMSPATAVLMRQLILGQELLLPLEAFACEQDARSGEQSAQSQ
jgi:glycine oxidase